MIVVFNKELTIPEVSKIHENIDDNFRETITFVAHYSNEIFENIKNFLKNNKTTLIEVYKDNELTKTFLNYTKFKTLFHRSTYGEIIELTMAVEDE